MPDYPEHLTLSPQQLRNLEYITRLHLATIKDALDEDQRDRRRLIMAHVLESWMEQRDEMNLTQEGITRPPPPRLTPGTMPVEQLRREW